LAFNGALLLAKKDDKNEGNISFPIRRGPDNPECSEAIGRASQALDLVKSLSRGFSPQSRNTYDGALKNARSKLEDAKATCNDGNVQTLYHAQEYLEKEISGLEGNQSLQAKVAQFIAPHFDNGMQWIKREASKGIDKASAFASWLKTKDAGQKLAIVGAVGLLVAATKIPTPQGKAAAGLLAVVAGSFGMNSGELINGIQKARS
jgi:hypothetical protein